VFVGRFFEGHQGLGWCKSTPSVGLALPISGEEGVGGCVIINHMVCSGFMCGGRFPWSDAYGFAGRADSDSLPTDSHGRSQLSTQ